MIFRKGDIIKILNTYNNKISNDDSFINRIGIIENFGFNNDYEIRIKIYNKDEDEYYYRWSNINSIKFIKRLN